MHLLSFIACVYALSSSVNAQGGSSVPADLSGSFDTQAVSLQTSYDGQSDNGFEDGTKFTTQETSKQPVFALGDASGVNTAIKFLVMMVDTTEKNNRVLHFLQPDFEASGDKTGISSQTKPVFAYKAPGSLGESGERQYSFLLYQQVGSFSGSDMPSSGDAFDIKSFQSSNNLKAPLAGNVMIVDTQGSSSGSSSVQSSQGQGSQETSQSSTSSQGTPSSAATPTVVAQSQDTPESETSTAQIAASTTEQPSFATEISSAEGSTRASKVASDVNSVTKTIAKATKSAPIAGVSSAAASSAAATTVGSASSSASQASSTDAAASTSASTSASSPLSATLLTWQVYVGLVCVVAGAVLS